MRTWVIFCLLGAWSVSGWSCLTGSIQGRDLRNQQNISIPLDKSKKATVLVFLSAKCPCSISHEPTLQKLAGEFHDFQFIALNANQNEDESFSSAHFQKSQFSFPVIRDSRAEIANQLKALKTPHAFVVGPEGQCWYDGGIDDSKDTQRAKKHYLKNALLEIRLGQEPSEKKVRTLGCVISR